MALRSNERENWPFRRCSPSSLNVSGPIILQFLQQLFCAELVQGWFLWFLSQFCRLEEVLVVMTCSNKQVAKHSRGCVSFFVSVTYLESWVLQDAHMNAWIRTKLGNVTAMCQVSLRQNVRLNQPLLAWSVSSTSRNKSKHFHLGTQVYQQTPLSFMPLSIIR